MNLTLTYSTAHELWFKIRWFIKLRWILAAFSIVIILLSDFYLSVPMIGLSAKPLAIATLILIVSNLIFLIINRYWYKIIIKDKLNHRVSKYYILLFFAQVLVDYICVTILIAYYGFLSFNLAIFYLPHIIIASIILEKRRYSFATMWVSLFFVYYLVYTHRQELDLTILGAHSDTSLIGGALIFALFITGIFHFMFYLVNLLVGNIVTNRNELYKVNQHLIAMDKEKQNYTLRATHELKAPFAAIQSYVDVILAGYLGKMDEKITEVLLKIKARCITLSDMIKNIIQLSNLRTSVHDETNFEKVAIVPLLMKQIQSFEVRAKSKNIGIVIETMPPENTMLRISINLIEILIDNLISNAIQYSPEGTKITINSSCDRVRFLFSVRDQGIGIPPEHIENIFREHFRCNNAVQFYQSGNGIGLAIVKEIARLHRGSIHVDSTLGKGSEFFFEIPL